MALSKDSLRSQSPGTPENQLRTRRGRCPHRPEIKICACCPTLTEYVSAVPSGGNFLVPARKLIRSRLKGRCRKAAPLRIPRPLRRNCSEMFRVAMGSSGGGTRIKNKSFDISTRFPAWEAGFSGLFNVYYIPTRIIGEYFSKPIDKIGIWVYYLAIESKQINERSGMQCLKSILMQHSLVVECVSPGHIRMAGCIRIHFVAPET